MGGHLADDMGIVADQRWGSAGQLSARRGSPDRASPRRVHPSTAGEPHVNPTGGSETEETPMAIQTAFNDAFDGGGSQFARSDREGIQ